MGYNLLQSIFQNANVPWEPSTTTVLATVPTMSSASFPTGVNLGFIKSFHDILMTNDSTRVHDPQQMQAEIVQFLIQSSSLSAEELVYTGFMGASMIIFLTVLGLMISCFIATLKAVIIPLLYKIAVFLEPSASAFVRGAHQVDSNIELQRFRAFAAQKYEAAKVKSHEFRNQISFFYDVAKVKPHNFRKKVPSFCESATTYLRRSYNRLEDSFSSNMELKKAQWKQVYSQIRPTTGYKNLDREDDSGEVESDDIDGERNDYDAKLDNSNAEYGSTDGEYENIDRNYEEYEYDGGAHELNIAEFFLPEGFGDNEYGRI
jgi:hypothetical protein